MMYKQDLWIAGSGPSALALAAHCSKAGLRVGVIAPQLQASWPNNYGLWLRQAEHLGVQTFLRKVWLQPQFFLDDDRALTLPQPYALLDNVLFQQELTRQCSKNRVEFVSGLAHEVIHDSTGSTILTRNGATLRADLFIDATGHLSRFVKRPPVQQIGYQSAYGIFAHVDQHHLSAQHMVFMDYRDVFSQEDIGPTFLYAMPLSSSFIFLEETSLVQRKAIPFELLKVRLLERCHQLGLQITHIESHENCLIPMGVPLPNLQQRTLGFGGAASMVHPATGYMFAQTLQLAPTFAKAISQELSLANQELTQRCARLWQILWPTERIFAWEIYKMGMEILIQLDQVGIRNFMRSFFSLSPGAWYGFLSASLTPIQLMTAMLGLFRQASPDIRKQLVKGILRSEQLASLRTLQKSFSYALS